MLFIAFWKFKLVRLNLHYLDDTWLLQRIVTVLQTMSFFYKSCSDSCSIYFIYGFVYKLIVIIISTNFADNHTWPTDLLEQWRALFDGWLPICHFLLFWCQTARCQSHEPFPVHNDTTLRFLLIETICSIGLNLSYNDHKGKKKEKKKNVYSLVLVFVYQSFIH